MSHRNGGRTRRTRRSTSHGGSRRPRTVGGGVDGMPHTTSRGHATGGDSNLKEDGKDTRQIAILYSGNHKNVMGRRWMEKLTRGGGGMVTAIQESIRPTTFFTLGDGRRVGSEGQYYLLMFIHRKKTRLVVDVVDADLLLLIARGEMEQLGITLHLDEYEIEQDSPENHATGTNQAGSTGKNGMLKTHR